MAVVVCLIPLPAVAKCICESSWLRWLLWKHLAFILKAFHLAGCASAQLLCHDLRRLRRFVFFKVWVHTRVNCTVSAIGPHN